MNMKVEELLKVMFDDQYVILVRNGLSAPILFYGSVCDMPETFKKFVVTSCYPISSNTLFVGVDEV